MIALGLMSGTSLDGIDAALVEIVPQRESYNLKLLRFETFAFDDDLLRALHAALPPSDASVAVVAALHHALGRAFAEAARAMAVYGRVAYVASHGQTLWHDGSRHVTLQIGDAFAIREAVEATVCYDFRSADCAAGGHGAPLVPYVDALLLTSGAEDRVALNVGGIANVTLLPKSSSHAQIVAFDTGPGNMLLDAFVRERTNGEVRYDRGGALAGSGRVDEDLLAAMLADGYFSQTPPKTTGRERFGGHFLTRFGERLARLRTEDGLATLTELTAASIAEAIAAAGLQRARVIVSGGGARNATLLQRLAERLEEARVETSDAMGIPAEAKEALAFAVLGYETLRGRAANVPHATGARYAVPLGAIAPHGLQTLLSDVEAECRMS
ncbi:MAG TPA: anhydro-N-acetylmuramic acid kinase [Candidatus Baltobacteraceae bacterium]|nr:anhydro-N-acetylmuramic acid kinase [Candidatus Baltobacteraceae bacterium]